MKKHLRLCLLAVLCFLSASSIIAQNPSITAQVGFPVSTKNSVQLAYGNDKYVLLGGYNNTASLNSLYSSSTATSWNLITASGLSVKQLNNIAFGAGLFVVVGNEGVIQTSADGINWTNRVSGSSSNLNRVYFINNKFFAAGYNRTLLTSPDGINWTTIAFNTGHTADFFMSLAYGNGMYILSARNNNGTYAVIYRSATAADNSWTSSTNALGAGTMINRIQFLNNKFFAFTSGNAMYNSADGNGWTNFTASVVLTNPNGTTTAWNSSHQIFNGVWDGSKYSFYGSSAFYSGYGSTFTSTDGVNLTLLTKTAYIVPQESNYINGLWLVCGNEGIVSSSDGLNYKHPGGSFREMVKTANKYVAVGMLGQDAQVYNSNEFSTWTDRSPSGKKEMYTVAYDGTHVLAGGSGGVMRSTNDGDSWTTIYSNASETFLGMAYGNGRFVAGVDGGGGSLRYSVNAGQTWTIASSADNYYIKVKYINNVFFAFGYDNATYESVIMYSADGISWANVTPNLGIEVLYYKDVAFDGTRYHFFGVESVSWTPVGFFSISTATPANSSSYANKSVIANTPAGVVLGGVWDEGVLEYVGGKFAGAVIDVATGQDYIIASNDGSSWTAIAQNSFSSITSAHISGNTARMIGRGNAFFTVTYGSILPVTLLQFDGRLSNGKTLLSWTTASEENAKEFIVQHSTNGRDWTIIGSVAAVGNSAQPVNYSFTHPSPDKGLNYYRLLMQDANEKTTQSRIITLNVGNEKRILSGYPNPVKNNFFIHTSNSGQGLLTIYNTAGQVVQTASIIGNRHNVDVSKMSDGTYYLVVIQGGEKEQLSFIKN